MQTLTGSATQNKNKKGGKIRKLKIEQKRLMISCRMCHFWHFKTCSLIHDGFISGQLTKGKQRKISQASAERQAISSYREEHLRLEF